MASSNPGLLSTSLSEVYAFVSQPVLAGERDCAQSLMTCILQSLVSTWSRAAEDNTYPGKCCRWC